MDLGSGSTYSENMSAASGGAGGSQNQGPSGFGGGDSGGGNDVYSGYVAASQPRTGIAAIKDYFTGGGYDYGYQPTFAKTLGGIGNLLLGSINPVLGGLNFLRKLRLIILPQAIKNILPAIGNQFVYVLKMSSLVSIIGIGDLTRKANELVVTTYRPLEIYTFLILEYLVLILIVSYFVRKLENKLKKD